MKNNFYQVAILFKVFLAAVAFLGSCYGYGLLRLDDFSAENPFFEVTSGFFTYVCDMPGDCLRRNQILLNLIGYGSYEYYDTCFIERAEDATAKVKRPDQPVRCHRIIDPTRTLISNYQPKPPDTFMPFGSHELCSKCSNYKKFAEGWTRLFYFHCQCNQNCRFFGPENIFDDMLLGTHNLTHQCRASDSGPNAYCECPIRSSNWSVRDNTTLFCSYFSPFVNCPINGSLS